MENISTFETKFGATTYTVERVFREGATENALQTIRRLLLQDARSESREKLSNSYLYPLDIRGRQS